MSKKYVHHLQPHKSFLGKIPFYDILSSKRNSQRKEKKNGFKSTEQKKKEKEMEMIVRTSFREQGQEKVV